MWQTILTIRGQMTWRKAPALILLGAVLLLVGCSHTPPPVPASRTGAATILDDSLMVLSRLSEQLRQWHGTPYRYGGMNKRGIDCSGFVSVTFRDQFHLPLPRETRQQAQLGRRISTADLRPGDLLFFNTGSGENGLHVGIYAGNQQFIHASTSQGVIRSSLTNRYWQQHFWQARRL